MPSILLRSAWQTTNIGDVCFTPSTLRLLETHIPEAKVTLWPGALNARIEAMIARRWPNLKIVRGDLDSKGEPLALELRRAFENTDLFFYNSGPLLNHGWGSFDWNKTVAPALPLFFCRELGKPFGCYAQSFDRFACPSEWIFRPLLSSAAWIFTRETDSLEYLQSLGVTPPILEFAPDAAFSFAERDDERALSYLRSLGLRDREFLVVLVRTVNNWLESSGRRDEFMAKMRAVICDWVRTTGLPVLICPEEEREIEPGHRLVRDLLPADVQARVFCRDEFWLPDEAASVYARARVLLGMEPHSNIMALAGGTPAVHPHFAGFGRKARMFQDIGLGEWLFDLGEVEAEQISAALWEIHDDYDGALEKVERAQKVVRKGEARAMNIARATVGLPARS